jgi:hypothetical protein
MENPAALEARTGLKEAFCKNERINAVVGGQARIATQAIRRLETAIGPRAINRG